MYFSSGLKREVKCMKTKKKWINISILVVLLLGAVVMVFPFYYMFITSLKQAA